MAEVCDEVWVESDPDVCVWVDAAPFRAHLTHVMAVGGMSVEVVAAMTGVSARAARHLVGGRGGRPVRRISAATGRRLLSISSADARTVRQRLVSTRGVRHQLREILRAGLGLATAAREAGVDPELLQEIHAGKREGCTPLTAAQITALHIRLDVGGEVGYPLAS